MRWEFPEYPSDWDEKRHKVYKRDNYTCQVCGEKGSKYGDKELHCAHIVSKSKGGTDDYSNLVTKCQDCHESEHPWLKKSRLAKEQMQNSNKSDNGVAKLIIKYLAR